MKKIALFALPLLLSASLSVKASEPRYLAEFLTTFRTVKNKLNNIVTEQNTVLFFYSDCCSSCLKEVALVDELAAHFPELTFIKINKREYKDIAASYNVTEPTFIFFKDGVEVDRYISVDNDDEDDCNTCITYKEDQVISLINSIYN
jgi:thiol-disulfide isomerase/thioredoxin